MNKLNDRILFGGNVRFVFETQPNTWQNAGLPFPNTSFLITDTHTGLMQRHYAYLSIAGVGKDILTKYDFRYIIDDLHDVIVFELNEAQTDNDRYLATYTRTMDQIEGSGGKKFCARDNSVEIVNLQTYAADNNARLPEGVWNHSEPVKCEHGLSVRIARGEKNTQVSAGKLVMEVRIDDEMVSYLVEPVHVNMDNVHYTSEVDYFYSDEVIAEYVERAMNHRFRTMAMGCESLSVSFYEGGRHTRYLHPILTKIYEAFSIDEQDQLLSNAGTFTPTERTRIFARLDSRDDYNRFLTELKPFNVEIDVTSLVQHDNADTIDVSLTLHTTLETVLTVAERASLVSLGEYTDPDGNEVDEVFITDHGIDIHTS